MCVYACGARCKYVEMMEEKDETEGALERANDGLIDSGRTSIGGLDCDTISDGARAPFASVSSMLISRPFFGP